MSTFLSIGSGPGMDLATAERFAREGFQVVLSARNEGKVRDLAEQLKAKGHKVEVRTVDAGDPASVAKLVEGVERDFGGIDVLHFNAASMRNQTLADQPRDSFNTDLAVNIGGAAVAAQAAAPKMLQRGSGSVLFTGGGFGLQPHPEYLSLSIGKAGHKTAPDQRVRSSIRHLQCGSHPHRTGRNPPTPVIPMGLMARPKLAESGLAAFGRARR